MTGDALVVTSVVSVGVVLLGVLLGAVLPMIRALGTRIDKQGEYLGGRIDAQSESLGRRIDVQGESLGNRIDACNARIDAINQNLQAQLAQNRKDISSDIAAMLKTSH